MPQVAPSHGTPTRSPSVNPLTPCADRRHTADDLVPRHDRQFRVFQFAVDHMQIGAADAAGRDLDQDFARPGAGSGRSRMTSGVRGASSTMARMVAIILPSNSAPDILDQMPMRTDTAQPIRLKDYRPPDWLVETVSLDVSLHPTQTKVRATLALKPNPAAAAAPLVLDGDGLTLAGLKLDGTALPAESYVATPDSLTIPQVPNRPFTLEIETLVDPTANTQLSGLYRSSGTYCTQCEAEGFRRITYFPDRPDVMAVYTTRIEADKTEAPVLLSNGNLIDSGDLAGGRHFAVWHDPHPKPVLSVRAGRRQSGVRRGSLRHHVGAQGRAAHLCRARQGKPLRLRHGFAQALDALGRGGVRPRIRPRYFHDRRGVRLQHGRDGEQGPQRLQRQIRAGQPRHRDRRRLRRHRGGHRARIFPQLDRQPHHLPRLVPALPEGRADGFPRPGILPPTCVRAPVKRISDVRGLRAAQFIEDAGPLAHPVRPETYKEINNFYTSTVYEKGAEVVRMVQTLIGREKFRAGMDLYFERHDGQAATVEQFIQCFADASGRDMTQFMRWYSQAGTPEVTVAGRYDAAAKIYTLEAKQSVPPTPGQPTKEPMVIPLDIGLVGKDGRDLPLVSQSDSIVHGVFVLSKPAASVEFTGIAERPVLSINRGFSAPIKLNSDLDADDLTFLAAHDRDAFNRWQALQTISMRLLIDNVGALQAGKTPGTDEKLIAALAAILADAKLEPAFMALALVPPGEGDVAREIGRDIDPDAVFSARRALRANIGDRLGPSFDRYLRAHDRPRRLFARCDQRRPPRIAQCGARPTGGNRLAGRDRPCRAAIRRRRQYDRPHGGADDIVPPWRTGARACARRFLCALRFQCAGDRQMVRPCRP